MTFAFVFPGQGSQSVGMLNSISERPEVRATLQEASEALGEDVAKLIAEGPAEALSLTTNTQPVMLTAGVAFYRAWLAAGGSAPQVMAGPRSDTKMDKSIHMAGLFGRNIFFNVEIFHLSSSWIHYG